MYHLRVGLVVHSKDIELHRVWERATGFKNDLFTKHFYFAVGSNWNILFQ